MPLVRWRNTNAVRQATIDYKSGLGPAHPLAEPFSGCRYAPDPTHENGFLAWRKPMSLNDDVMHAYHRDATRHLEKTGERFPS